MSNVITYVVNEMVLGQVVTFPRTNCNIEVSCEKYHSRSAKCWEVPSIVIRIAFNKHFVINMIMFITMFARRSNAGSANYFLYKYFM